VGGVSDGSALGAPDGGIYSTGHVTLEGAAGPIAAPLRARTHVPNMKCLHVRRLGERRAAAAAETVSPMAQYLAHPTAASTAQAMSP
jgi:hypothetical protein